MNFISAALRGFKGRIRKKLLFALIIINLLTTNASAQTNFTQNQFSRFLLLTRARFFENEILKAANREGVDPNVLWAIAYNETRFRPWLTSPKNAQGLMQFIPSTAARYDLTNPYEPVSAIRAAARYVKFLSNLFGGRIDSILAAYNSGEGTVSAFLTGKSLRSGQKIINPKGLRTIGGVPPYAETVLYVGRGLKIYRWLTLRGTFPAEIARAVFPTVISATVARVSLVDYELGKIPDFKMPVYIPQTVAQTSAAGGIIKENANPNLEKSAQTNTLTEIYYDSRSGTRYRVIKGNKTRLDESGIVVISNNSRPETTNKARSTFFASAP
jgi:hypothetical protein